MPSSSATSLAERTSVRVRGRPIGAAICPREAPLCHPCLLRQGKATARKESGALLLIVQPRSAGVGSRRARSRVNAGVVRGPVCRTLTGHFIGQVLRDTRAVQAAERQRDAGQSARKGFRFRDLPATPATAVRSLGPPTTMSSRLAIGH
jgi:hypothetical protein